MTHSQHMFNSAIHTFEFLDLVDVGGVAISVESNICIGAIRLPNERKKTRKKERKKERTNDYTKYMTHSHV